MCVSLGKAGGRARSGSCLWLISLCPLLSATSVSQPRSDQRSAIDTPHSQPHPTTPLHDPRHCTRALCAAIDHCHCHCHGPQRGQLDRPRSPVQPIQWIASSPPIDVAPSHTHTALAHRICFTVRIQQTRRHRQCTTLATRPTPSVCLSVRQLPLSDASLDPSPSASAMDGRSDSDSHGHAAQNRNMMSRFVQVRRRGGGDTQTEPELSGKGRGKGEEQRQRQQREQTGPRSSRWRIAAAAICPPLRILPPVQLSLTSRCCLFVVSISLSAAAPGRRRHCPCGRRAL